MHWWLLTYQYTTRAGTVMIYNDVVSESPANHLAMKLEHLEKEQAGGRSVGCTLVLLSALQIENEFDAKRLQEILERMS